MRKHVMWLGVMLVLLLVAGMVYAQGRDRSKDKRGWGMPDRTPSRGGTPFGPGHAIAPPPAPAPSRGRMPFGPMPPMVKPPAIAPAPAPAPQPCAMMATSPSQTVATRPCQGSGARGDRCPFAGNYGPVRRHHWRPVRALISLLVAVPVLLVLFWILPISLGVWIARRKNLSALWMLFGICPLGGWTACLVLALSRAKVACATCGGYVKSNFRQCPFCDSPVEGASATETE